MTDTRTHALVRIVAAVALISAVVLALWLAPHVRDRLDASRDLAAATMTVSGEATMRVPASAATVTINLRGQGATQAASLTSYNRALRRAQLTLRRAGVTQRQLEASSQGTYQEGSRRGAWVTTGSLDARITDIDDVGGVMQAITSLKTGVAGVQGPQYEYDEQRVADRVLAKAVDAARDKAEAAARRTGMHVTGIARLSEKTSRPAYPYPMAMTSGGSADANFAMRSARPTGGGTVGALGGTRSTSATVTITFRLQRA